MPQKLANHIRGQVSKLKSPMTINACFNMFQNVSKCPSNLQLDLDHMFSLINVLIYRSPLQLLLKFVIDEYFSDDMVIFTQNSRGENCR